MQDLEEQLIAANDARYKIIVTDGVFSMDGIIAPLKEICDLADKYNALVFVDDSHSVGFIGEKGRGTHEFCDCLGRVDIMTGTLGKALGGASGGYVSASKKTVETLRQKARTNLFSNSLAPSIVGATIAVLNKLVEDNSLVEKIKANTKLFREGIQNIGLEIIEGEHPIVPIMIGDAALAVKFSEELLKLGIYVIAFSYPVVPKGLARIRVQISASHSEKDIKKAIDAFGQVNNKLFKS